MAFSMTPAPLITKKSRKMRLMKDLPMMRKMRMMVTMMMMSLMTRRIKDGVDIVHSHLATKTLMLTHLKTVTENLTTAQKVIHKWVTATVTMTTTLTLTTMHKCLKAILVLSLTNT